MPSNWLYIDTNFPTFTGQESTEKKVTTIQNYMFMLVEQLRYTLHNLDLSNMNDTAVKEYGETLTEPLYARIKGQEGELTQLKLDQDGLAVQVSNLEGDVTSFGVTVDGLAAQVSDAEGDIAAVGLTVDGLAVRVGNAEGNIQSLTFTLNGLIVTGPGGVTLVQGGKIDTDTLIAKKIGSGYVAMLDGAGQVAGHITLTSASTAGYAVDIYSNAALRLTAAVGSLYLNNNMGFAYLDTAFAGWVTNNCYPSGDNEWNCGRYDRRWMNVYVANDAYAATGVVRLSDRNAKTDIQSMPEKYTQMLYDIEPSIFRMKDGTSGRYHPGFIAQDVESAMEDNEITDQEFAGLVISGRDTETPVYMLRYEEFIPIAVKAIQDINRRVMALENTGGEAT